MVMASDVWAENAIATALATSNCDDYQRPLCNRTSPSATCQATEIGVSLIDEQKIIRDAI